MWSDSDLTQGQTRTSLPSVFLGIGSPHGCRRFPWLAPFCYLDKKLTKLPAEAWNLFGLYILCLKVKASGNLLHFQEICCFFQEICCILCYRATTKQCYMFSHFLILTFILKFHSSSNIWKFLISFQCSRQIILVWVFNHASMLTVVIFSDST